MFDRHWKKEHKGLPDERFGFVKAGGKPRTGAAEFKRTIKLLDRAQELGCEVEVQEETPGEECAKPAAEPEDEQALSRNAATNRPPEVPWPPDDGTRQTRSKARSQSKANAEEKLYTPKVSPIYP